MQDYFSEPIFILGLPRSGTSMIAGSLGICGVWTGETVPACSVSNPKGFFEHTIIREQVIKKLLIQIGCDPLGVRKLPSVDIQGEIQGLTDIIKGILERGGYKNNQPWLYKDAKLTLLWPYFLKAFPDAKWLIVTRDEEGFIDSCLRTPFMKQHSTDRNFWREFSNEYQARLKALKSSGANVLEVSSSAIIAGDFSVLKKAISQLNLSYRKKKLREFISPKHWHSNPEENLNKDV